MTNKRLLTMNLVLLLALSAGGISGCSNVVGAVLYPND